MKYDNKYVRRFVKEVRKKKLDKNILSDKSLKLLFNMYDVSNDSFDNYMIGYVKCIDNKSLGIMFDLIKKSKICACTI